MYKIIDKLIDIADNEMQTNQNVELVSSVLFGSDASVKYHDSCPIPNGIEGHLHDNNLDSDLSVSHDFDIADKIRGFLNHSSGNFSFIGPDRDQVTISTIQQCFDIAKVIRDTGLPNYMQARIPLNSGLNLQAWEYRLREYPDKFLFQYLKFGVPLSLSHPTSLHNVDICNHPSALAYPEAVDEYIAKEVVLGAILGPCDHSSFGHYHCSPLLTCPKDTDKRHVILNLSYPYGASVNDSVSKSHFDGRRFTLKFPLIVDIVQDIHETEDPVIFKVDVVRAFRNLRVNPVDTIKFGLSLGECSYVDLSVAFGWTHGSAAFQMASDAIAFIMKGMGCEVHAYIDDYVVVAKRGLAHDQFNNLVNLLQELGLPMNEDKKTPPSQLITCLGIQIDIPNATISIDPNKPQSIFQECVKTSHKKFITKKGLQSLISKLIYIHKCVSPARAFMNRMLGLLRSSKNTKRIRLKAEFFSDLEWFLKFLPHFNRITMFKRLDVPSQETIHLDACLSGMGGIWSNRVYSCPAMAIPGTKLHINHLEMFNIVLPLRFWGKFWANASVCVRCDNLAVVQVVQNLKTKDNILAA